MDSGADSGRPPARGTKQILALVYPRVPSVEVEKELERAPQEGRCATSVGLSHAGETSPSHTTAEEKGDGHAAVSQTAALFEANV